MNCLKGGVAFVILILFSITLLADTTWESTEACTCDFSASLTNGSNKIIPVVPPSSNICSISESNCVSGNTFLCIYEGDYSLKFTCPDTDRTDDTGSYTLSNTTNTCTSFSCVSDSQATILYGPTMFNVNFDDNPEACMQTVNKRINNDPEVYFNDTLHTTLPIDANFCCGDDTTDQFYVTENGKYVCTNRTTVPDVSMGGVKPSGVWEWTYSVSNEEPNKILTDSKTKQSIIAAELSGWFLCDANGKSIKNDLYVQVDAEQVLSNHEVLSDITYVESCRYDPPCADMDPPKIWDNSVPPNLIRSACCYYEDDCITSDLDISNHELPCYDYDGNPWNPIEITSASTSTLSSYERAIDLVGSSSSSTIPLTPVQDCTELYDNIPSNYLIEDCSLDYTCNFGIEVVKEDTDGNPVGSCCIGTNPSCFTPPTCRDQGFIECGDSEIWTCDGESGTVDDMDGTTLCCNSYQNCKVNRNKVFDIYATARTSKFMCNMFENANYVTECCNDFSECLNMEEQYNSDKNYLLKDRNVVSMGSVSNQIKSFDQKDASGYRYLNYGIRKTISSYSPSATLVGVINEFIDGYRYDTLEFYLRFNELKKSENTRVIDYNLDKINLEVYDDGNNLIMDIPLVFFSSKNLIRGNWVKVIIPISNKRFNLKELRFNFIDGNAKGNWNVDQISLNSKSDDYKNYYCTPLNSWVEKIEFDQNFKDDVINNYDLESWTEWKNNEENLAEYIKNKWTCDLNFAYEWTGTSCCGQGQTSLDNEYFNDIEGGCWAGYAVSNMPVATKIFGSETTGKYMYNDKNFHECGYVSPKKDKIIEDLTTTIIEDDFCDVNGDYVCDYEKTFYVSSRIGGKLKNESKTMFVVNQLFDGDFDGK